jgi:hypothetical protein
VFCRPLRATNHEEHCPTASKLAHFFIAEEQELPKHTENMFCVREDEDMVADIPTVQP